MLFFVQLFQGLPSYKRNGNPHIIFLWKGNSRVSPMQIPCKSHFSPILWNGLATALERYYNGLTAKAKRGQEREWKSRNTSLKKLFRTNPTPLHHHPLYSSKPQPLAAFSNICKPYINPTPTLHPNLNFSEIQVN